MVKMKKHVFIIIKEYPDEEKGIMYREIIGGNAYSKLNDARDAVAYMLDQDLEHYENMYEDNQYDTHNGHLVRVKENTQYNKKGYEDILSYTIQSLNLIS